MSKRAPSPRQLEKAVLELLSERGTATACPSEVARALDAENWRHLMAPVRAAAARLQQRGQVDVYQHGKAIRMEDAHGPVRLRAADVKTLDYRRDPSRYRIGKGEQGVLTVEPYKSEILPLWRFATAAQAQNSALAIWKKFLAYGRAEDFVGMDMARKFLQMGYTRSRRYAKHRGGRKYEPGTRSEKPRIHDEQKAEAAEVFRVYWQRALEHPRYQALRRQHESTSAAASLP